MTGFSRVASLCLLAALRPCVGAGQQVAAPPVIPVPAPVASTALDPGSRAEAALARHLSTGSGRRVGLGVGAGIGAVVGGVLGYLIGAASSGR